MASATWQPTRSGSSLLPDAGTESLSLSRAVLLSMSTKIFIIGLVNLALGYGLATAASRSRNGDGSFRRRASDAAHDDLASPDADAGDASVPVADAEQVPSTVESSAANDSAASIPEPPVVCAPNLISRAALERALGEWWRSDSGHARPVTVGLIAVDQLRPITSDFGPATANQILEKLTEIVANVTRREDLVSRSAGSRLLVLFPDTPADDSTAALERVRQTIEATQFLRGPEMLEVSVTCAVAERTAEDTPEALLARVEATLLDARRSGGNRTFLHAGMFSAPVSPPPVDAEISVCTL